VYSVAAVRPDLGVRPGKGEAMWKSMFTTQADLVAFIDADLTDWGIHFVTGVLGPLLAHETLMLCRGFYDRILSDRHGASLEGGRVTELVARPWLALFRPDLAEVVQPLAGEWAIRRSVFETLHLPTGYGVEFATLLDVHARFGLDGIGQTDLGHRAHRHQGLHDLSAMALEILAVAERRKGDSPHGLDQLRVMAEDTVPVRWLDAQREWRERSVDIRERQPLADLRSRSSPSEIHTR
jgi:glucosyl-3-phosphoglycerate synthase